MVSRSIATEFVGVPCPMQMSFGFVHGPAAAVAHLRFPGKVLPPPGTIGAFFIGPSQYVGFVTNREYDPINDTSSVRMADWRDRLHDTFIRAAFNCQESDGRYYHIFPGEDWFTQRRTWVTKDLGQFDFQDFQDLPVSTAFTTNIGKNNLYSAYTLLNAIASSFNINMTADALALSFLRQSYPLNLDWNNGNTTTVQCIQQIVQKCGMQFTCFGAKNMHITIRGLANTTFSQSLTNGLLNPCLFGVSSGKIGEELNEQGRRVTIVGDKNKYEYVFGCRANWNPAWTWGMAYNGIELSALLKSLNLTEFAKLKQLPFKYQDFETYSESDNAGKGALEARKTRNEMTVREYLDKIVFKCYVVEARGILDMTTVNPDFYTGVFKVITRDRLNMQAATFPLNQFPKSTGYNDPESNFFFPLSKSLVTDSNLQFLVYAINRKIVRGKDFPFGTQHTFVPRSQGVSLEAEEVVNPNNGRAEHRIRIYFNEPQYYLPPGMNFDDPRSVEPDLVAVRLCLDADYFIWQQGEVQQNLRVREQTVSVRSLYRAFVNNVEQTVLRENFRRDLKKGGKVLQSRPVMARDIAKRIATQLLMHQAITTSGNLTFRSIAGAMPDGIIDSVSVNFDAKSGIEEHVNFTSGFLDDREINSPIPVRLSKPFKNEEEIVRDRLIAMAKEAMKDKAAAGKALAIMDAGLHEPGALVGIPVGFLAHAKEGVAAVDIGKDIVQTITESEAWGGGTVMVLNKPQ
jgi:hypothetical protein